MKSVALKVGVDVGGTFTDVALIDERKEQIRIAKLLTTPTDPSDAIVKGIDGLLTEHAAMWSDLELIVHGTTLVANTLIERKGARTGMIVTSGFRDNLEIGMEPRYDTYDLFMERPKVLVQRHLRLGVEERILADGSVYRPLDESAVLEAAALLTGEGVDSVAVVLMHSYANDVHERRIAALLAEGYPDLDVTLSSVIAPEIREYERTVTTTANAYVRPLMSGYLDRLERRVREKGFPGDVLLMLSSGATSTLEAAREAPIRLVESGPASGALAAARYGRLTRMPDLVSFDMGGTTAKICLIQGSEPSRTTEFEVARLHRFKPGSGLPLRISAIQMIEIGAGGGSIAHVDDLGFLQVGPESSSAEPGPACYGRGGKEPTVTDADLLLGYLNADYFLGGRMKLDRTAAEQSIRARVAEPLGIDLGRAAQGINEVVNQSMAQAARIHIIERGEDPRRFALVAFGGAGPVHAYAIARLLKLQRVIVPPAAGITSALGLLEAPRAFDYSQTYVCRITNTDWAHIDELYQVMERRALEEMDSAGVHRDEVTFSRAADMRYVGQGHEIPVSLPERGEATTEAILEAFYDTYKRLFGRHITDVPVEALVWRLRAAGPTPELRFQFSGAEAAGLESSTGTSRQVYFAELRGMVDTPVLNRYELRPGERLQGPAVIEERESTIVVGPQADAVVDENGNVLMSIH